MRAPASKTLIVTGVLAVGLGTVAWLASRDAARAIRRDDVYIRRLVVVGRLFSWPADQRPNTISAQV